MYTNMKAVGLVAALASGAYAQSPSVSTLTAPSVTSVTAPTLSSSSSSSSSSPSQRPHSTNDGGLILATSDILELVSEVAPTLTSIDASALSKLYTDVNTAFGAEITGIPLNPLVTASSVPNNIVQAINSVNNNDDPNVALSSIAALVSGLPASSAIVAYESSVLQAAASFSTQVLGIVNSDLGITATGFVTTPGVTASPSPTSSSSSGLAAAPTAAPGVVMGAVAAAAGVVGMAML